MSGNLPIVPSDLPEGPHPSEPTARLGPHVQPNINVQVNAHNLNVNPSNLAALERIVQISPDVASQIVQVSAESVRSERDRYKVAAICAAVICGLLLVCSAAVAISGGFWAGIAFFLACVVAAAIVGTIFTGTVQDLLDRRHGARSEINWRWVSGSICGA